MLGWNNVVSTLYQCCATLFRRCFNVGDWRCINFVQHWKSDVVFCFIFNVGSTFFQRWFTTLKQRWSDFEMLAGNNFKSYKTYTDNYNWRNEYMFTFSKRFQTKSIIYQESMERSNGVKNKKYHHGVVKRTLKEHFGSCK